MSSTRANLCRLLAVATCTAVAGCGPSVGSDKTAWPPGELVHDFGVVRPRTKHRHVFRVQNTSGYTLLFDRFDASCNCTQVRIDKEKIPPGEWFRVHISYAAGRSRQDAKATVVAHFRGERPSAVTFRLLAKVRSPLSVTAGELR